MLKVCACILSPLLQSMCYIVMLKPSSQQCSLEEAPSMQSVAYVPMQTYCWHMLSSALCF